MKNAKTILMKNFLILLTLLAVVLAACPTSSTPSSSSPTPSDGDPVVTDATKAYLYSKAPPILTTDTPINVSSQSGANNYENAIAYAQANPAVYTLVLGEDISSGPTSLASYSGNLTLWLMGQDSERTISLSSNGRLFSMISSTYEVTLILGDNITLKGKADNGINSVVDISSGGRLEMKDGSVISDNTGTVGTGVSVYSTGTFTMSGGTIRNNIGGGGVSVSGGGTFTMSGGSISGNSTTGGYFGGGVEVRADSTFTMTGGSITGNTASGGGGVSVVGGTFTMSGGEISGNTAKIGGGVYVEAGTFRMVTGTVYGSEAILRLMNTAFSGGAALWVGGGTAQRGTLSGSTWNSLGTLSNSETTIKVANGAIVP